MATFITGGKVPGQRWYEGFLRRHPYSAYKLKDKLIVLAGALELDTTGTIPVIKERIKEYLDLHKNELVQNPRFFVQG